VRAKDADELAERVSSAIQTKQPIQAYSLLEPLLTERTPFRTLDRIGERIGNNTFAVLSPFLKPRHQSWDNGRVGDHRKRLTDATEPGP
jgi:hypothetical protein